MRLPASLIIIFAVAMQIAGVALAVAFVWAVIFHPETIGAALGKIIVGFQDAVKGGAA